MKVRKAWVETMQTNPKDRWDKAQIVGTVVGSVAIPLVLLLLGNWLTQSLRESETRARLVELSIAVLREDPNLTPEIPGLRDLAIETLTTNLSIDFPSDTSQLLLTKRLPAASGNISPAGCCVTCDGLTTCGLAVNAACGSCGPWDALRRVE